MGSILTNDINSEPGDIKPRQVALSSKARVRLITGAPGAGKTYFGCKLAQHEITLGRLVKEPYQKILFLTFARNAVARIRQTYIEQASQQRPEQQGRITKESLTNRIRIETFASFFWWIVDAYGRYAPKGSQLRPWLIGNYATGFDFIPEGYIGYTFNELKKSALSILNVDVVRSLISDIYPLVIVDEHQDIDYPIHDIICLLYKKSNLVLLRGPGQCIYRNIHKFDPNELLTRAKIDLMPEYFDIPPLGIGQQRYCSEIERFLYQYDSNSKCIYDGKRLQIRMKPQQTRDGNPNPLETHVAIAVRDLTKFLKDLHSGKKSISIAVLASTNRAVAQIHKRIIEGSSTYNVEPRKAVLLFDEMLLLHYGRFIFKLLSGHWIATKKTAVDTNFVAASLASFLKAAENSSNISYSDFIPLSQELTQIVARMRRPSLESILIDKFENDLYKINKYLSATKAKLPKGTPKMPFNRADSSLLKWLTTSFVQSIKSLIKPSGVMNINEATLVFEKSLQQRIIIEKLGMQKGIEVMTIHKSKGREFDGVVLVLENDHTALWRNSKRTTDEEVDDLYRVAISRARDALIVVTFDNAATEARTPVNKILLK